MTAELAPVAAILAPCPREPQLPNIRTTSMSLPTPTPPATPKRA